MKLLLIALLSALASVTGQLTAPEMAVFYVNEKASPTACTSAEYAYVNSQMLPDITSTFQENNYVTPDWSVTTAVASDIGTKLLATASSSACDFCRTRYPRSLCNGMYACGFRRQLRRSENRKLARDATLEAGLIADCQAKLDELAFSAFLSRTCRNAIKASTCQVVFVESNSI